MLQARLAQVAVDQNNDMRKIASWAAIAALQTAFAGIYGMNFKYMPELEWRYGYPGLLIIMLVTSVMLYRYLRKVGWLYPPARRIRGTKPDRPTIMRVLPDV